MMIVQDSIFSCVLSSVLFCLLSLLSATLSPFLPPSPPPLPLYHLYHAFLVRLLGLVVPMEEPIEEEGRRRTSREGKEEQENPGGK